MELDKLPNVVNVLDFWDHYTKHVMAYVTPDQNCKNLRMHSSKEKRSSTR